MNYQETLSYNEKNPKIKVTGQVTLDKTNDWCYVDNLALTIGEIEITDIVDKDIKESYEEKLIEIAIEKDKEPNDERK